ncbi:hypothetical protein [Erythrobacter sp. JK5]|uniref:hypothetical protein n=1 Tax=Erythrobacter sp. JK5 TaxID=2829500 RepID=UPI001BAC8BC2|nr:hypothetical protein [Erythrobacter sp. JK5]QUL38787.1 hypothetical protein KDC96_05290 [Erythrobacter sp. JK5]
MAEGNTARPAVERIGLVLATLEQQLLELDRIGSLLAAAHLDAAIQQLRLEQMKRAVARDT